MAGDEHLVRLPEQPFPALIEVGRKVGDSSLVAWRGNRYSILPGLEGATVLVRPQLGSDHLEIVSPAGITLARHLREPDGACVIRRLDEHCVAQEHAVLAAFGSGRRCRHKVRRPLSPEALVRGRVKFRVGSIVYASFSRDETVMGFGFPKAERDGLVASDPETFFLPGQADLRYQWVCAHLDRLDDDEMRELVVDAWRMCPPKMLHDLPDQPEPVAPSGLMAT